MGKLILPLLLAVVGLAAGTGAGIILAPDKTAPEETAGKNAAEDSHGGEKTSEKNGDDHAKDGEAKSEPIDYVKLNNQFVVPLVSDGRVVSLVVLSLSLEIEDGTEETIYEREPKLRDAFLRVLFDHANAGGFSGEFTQPSQMLVLRESLLEIAKRTMGDIVVDVLIADLVRQDN